MAKDNSELAAKIEAKTPTERPKTVADRIADVLQKPEIKAQLAAALPNVGITPERITRVVLTVIRQTPTLLECTPESLMSCVIQACILGLEPGVLGRVYFVPYNKNIGSRQAPKWVKEAQFQIGYKGLLDLARRSGEIKNIAAHAIYSKDTFHVEYGFNQTLQHIPAPGDRGEVAAFYAFAVTKDGGEYCEVMTIDEVRAIRDRSKSKDSGPWVTDFNEMARKTVLRRLCKYLPLSIEIAETVAGDEEKEFSDATKIEMNLGTTEGGAWPAISPPDDESNAAALKEIAERKLTARRNLDDVAPQQVADLVPLGPNEKDGEPLFQLEN